MDKLILASGSPRRKQLLGQAHIDFDFVSPDVDETNPPGMNVRLVPEFLAKKKAAAVAQFYPDRCILAADTVVILDDEILGKAKDLDDAKCMLTRLSGRGHQVITGVCLRKGGQEFCFSETTEVVFRKLTQAQIDEYVEKYKPLDKAGSYAIQEYIGIVGIESIHGDYYNVMGLPVGKISLLLHNECLG